MIKLRNWNIKNFQNIFFGINKIKCGLYEKKKKKKGNVISRIVTINSIDSEIYYLRLLLNHIRGATSFQHLKNVNGIETSSFREAAQLNGLLEGDDNIELCLKETSFYQMLYILHCLFAIILIYSKLNNPKKLWENFEQAMSDDYALLDSK